jgi:1-acyl-sn-glycerol-3-phosphate acyltransferase
VLAQGRRLGAQGNWVIMFPEGTRIARGQAGDYKTGGTRLAIEAGLPVVPIAATSARCWPRKSFLLRPGVVDISIGRQIRPEGREPAEMMREVRDWIEGEMQRLDPDGYSSPPTGFAGPHHGGTASGLAKPDPRQSLGRSRNGH